MDKKSINIYVFCLICIFIIIESIGVEAQVISDIEIVSDNVWGPGSSSIYDNGLSYNTYFNFTNKSKMDDYDLLFNLGVKSQEDTRLDQQVILLSRLRANLSSSDKNSIFNIGDTFEFFDQYVLNSSLKGVSYKNNISENESMTFVFGYDYPRWENFFNDDYQAINRRSLGLNFKKKGNDGLQWGFSFLNTDDNEAVEDDDILYKNNVYGLNWEFIPVPGLTVRGSSAYGSTEESSGKNYAGTAHKLKIYSNAREGKASIDYERVDPGFKTLLGSATSDVEKYKASLLYRYSNRINYNFDYIYYHDNLNNQKDTTTYNHKPGVGVSIRRIFNRRYASTSLNYNVNIKETEERRIEDNIISLNYRDRFKIVDLGMNINYSQGKRNIDNDITRDNELTYNLSLSTRKRMDKFILRPVLRLGYFKNNDEDNDSNDVNFEKSLGLGLDIPEKRISSNIRLGERNSVRDDAENNNKVFADLNIHYRPQVLEKYNQGRIYLKVRYNDLTYSESVDNNLTENSITTGINFGF